MTISERINEDYKSAMKQRDKLRIETLRMLRAQLQDAQIAKGGELEEGDVVAALTTAAKRRKEAIAAYRQAERQDLSDQESAELEVISAYLPQQLSEAEVTELIEHAIAEAQATSMKELGKVMSLVMPQLKGRADGKLVQQIARAKLA